MLAFWLLPIGAICHVAPCGRAEATAPVCVSPPCMPLTWAPPADWEEYEPIEVPASGGVIVFPRNDVDYRIIAREVVRGKVTLRGGRNIVWIGGHIRIDRNDAENGRYIHTHARHALFIEDGSGDDVIDGRIVFLEGLRIDGDDLAEGIDTVAAKAHIILQNIGLGVVRHRGFDDRDSTGPYVRNLPQKNHPDLIQLFGGYKSLRIDGLSGRTQYQGLQLVAEVRPAGSVPGPIYLRRLDMEAVELPDDVAPFSHAGQKGLSWYGDATGRMFVDNGTVWFRHHANSGWDETRYRRVAFRDEQGEVRLEPVSGDSKFEHNFRAGPIYPRTYATGSYGAVSDSDEVGVYVTWPDTAVLSDGHPAFRDWSGIEPGRIYSGLPPSGPYVPLSKIGLNYRTPGYANYFCPGHSAR